MYDAQIHYLAELTRRIDPSAVEQVRRSVVPVLEPGEPAVRLAAGLATAYPAFAPVFRRDPLVARRLTESEVTEPRTRTGLLEALRAALLRSATDDLDVTRAVLRRFARDERMRVALRELLPEALGGADVDVTARELSELADATIQVALDEATAHAVRRHGLPLTAQGTPSRFVVLGMGKLGGRELNAGSDVDLIYCYDSDEGAAREGGEETSLHDFWTRVARRMTSTLEDVTEDGFVWRVDLRLRPEGSRGALVNSLGAAERYYESFGRLWERAALLRARACAGDEALGAELLEVLAPFVWRRQSDPRIAGEMIRLVRQARAELSRDPERDLKLGPGGIREAEFFVQSLALIWGGRDRAVRERGTLEALSRLGSRGLLTDREGVGIFDAYLALRRAEHSIQFASGIQTHELPDDPGELERLAFVQGFTSAASFVDELNRHRAYVAARFASLAPGQEIRVHMWAAALTALDEQERETFVEAVDRVAQAAGRGTGPAPGLDWSTTALSLFELSRHPDALLGARSRAAFPALGEGLLDAIMDAADAEQAARYLQRFSARVRHPGVYVRLLGNDPQAVRRLVAVLGASAFVGDAVSSNPELGDMVLFTHDVPTPGSARSEVPMAQLGESDEEAPEEQFVGDLRRAKARVTLQVALADLAGDIGVRDATAVLSALADATLEAATRFALGTPVDGAPTGLCVVAMGKLGGQEIGYGSDLDVIFVYEPSAAPAGKEPAAYFTRVARTIIRLITSSHGAGPGYELDTRLRPSGNQGMLVTSLEAFARYHAAEEAPDRPRRAATWERMALLRARRAAGDPLLGQRVEEIARQTAYGGMVAPGSVAQEIHRIRTRVEREASLERAGRHDLKLGWGGLLDVEFSAQMLQMIDPHPERVTTTETLVALEALARCGALAPSLATDLIDGYQFLRRLEQRIRIVHADASHLLDEHAPGLTALARRMGFREQPGLPRVAEQLLTRYREVTSRVRHAYEAIVLGGISADVPAEEEGSEEEGPDDREG